MGLEVPSRSIRAYVYVDLDVNDESVIVPLTDLTNIYLRLSILPEDYFQLQTSKFQQDWRRSYLSLNGEQVADANRRMQKGRELFHRGAMDESLDVFKQLHNDRPYDPTILNNYAALLIVGGQIDEAEEILQNLLITSDMRLPRFNLACLYVIKGDDDRAMRHLRYLERAGWPGLALVLGDPHLDPLRSRPDFINLSVRVLAWQDQGKWSSKDGREHPSNRRDFMALGL